MKRLLSSIALVLLPAVAIAATVRPWVDVLDPFTKAPSRASRTFGNYSSLTKVGTGAGNVPTWNGGAWPGGGGGGDATSVTYSNPTYTTVAAALDSLLYVAPSILTHTNRVTYGPTSPFNQYVSTTTSTTSIEIGNTVSKTELFWTLNKTVTSQSYNNSIGTLDPALRAYTYNTSYSTYRGFTLTVGDGTSTDATPATSVYFYPKRYWGTSSANTLTSAQVLTLAGSEFGSAHSKTAVVYDCTGGAYPYYVYPASWGLLTAVKVGGLAYTDYYVYTLSHTNSSGYTQNYYVYRLSSLQTGAAITIDWD